MPSDAPDSNGGYSPGHPWHYHLGGRPLTLKQIRESVRRSGYRGYMAGDIAAIDRKAEPQRSAELRRLRAHVLAELKADISRYRDVVRDLRRYRESAAEDCTAACCNDVHVAISLKHNHIYNDFGHLILLDDLLTRQGDLFGI
jgi:hypothetical protein